MDNSNTKILPENTIPNGKKNTSLKVFALGLVSLLLLVADWWLINLTLYGDKPLWHWIWPTLITALAITFLTLFALVNYSRINAISFGVISLASYLAIFPKDPFVYLGGAIFFILMYWFEQRIRSEEKSRQAFSIRRASASSISVIIYAFLILFGLNIYYNTSADFKRDPQGFYDALGRSAAKSTRYLTGEERAGLDLNQTIDQFLETEARKEVPNYDQIPESQKQQFREQARQEFFRQLNIQANGDQSIAEIIATFAVDKVRASAERFPQLFPLIFTLIIFALLRGFAFLFRWLTLGLTWVVFRILLALKFFRIAKVPVEVDKLEI